MKDPGRLLRLTAVWNWIPAFRVVAETQHLPTAAERLRVSPSALSRTIRLLEESLDVALFYREGRSIRLSPGGEEFLLTVRDAMRLVDDGLQRLTESVHSGPLHFTVAGPFNFTMPKVLESLRNEFPDLLPFLHTYVPDEANALLLRGQLDVVFTPEPVRKAGLSVEPVGDLSSGIYCGRAHPLFRARKVSLQRALEHAFAAPVPEQSGLIADSWPPDLDRTVKLYVQQLHVALAVCADGEYLAVFPDQVARTYSRSKELRRLPLDVLPPTRLYAVRRRQLTERDSMEVLIQTVRRHWG